MNTAPLFNAFMSVISEDGIHLRPEYSGRGMYGRKCIGFTGSDSLSIIGDIVQVVMEDDDQPLIEVAEIIRTVFECPKTDSMGRDIIVYFPNITLVMFTEDEQRQLRDSYES